MREEEGDDALHEVDDSAKFEIMQLIFNSLIWIPLQITVNQKLLLEWMLSSCLQNANIWTGANEFHAFFMCLYERVMSIVGEFPVEKRKVNSSFLSSFLSCKIQPIWKSMNDLHVTSRVLHVTEEANRAIRGPFLFTIQINWTHTSSPSSDGAACSWLL